MEAYCSNCRRSYEDVADQPCSVVVVGNEHLRGGPIGVRAKRTGSAAAAPATSIVQPVIRPRPTLHPVPRPQPVPIAPPARPRPGRRRRSPIPISAGQAVALMLPFDLDATLTG